MFAFRFIALAAAFTLVPLCAAPAFADESAHASASAPADEYFGPLHLSVLGIANTLRTATERERANAAGDAFAAIATVERSVRDWENQYPRDPWLARSILALRSAYAASTDAAASAKVAAIGTWLVARYPGTAEADAVLAQEAPPRVVDPVEALFVAPAAAPAPARACPSYATCR